MKRSQAVAFMVLAAACWGLGTIASKFVLGVVPPVMLLVLQLAVSVLCLWCAFLVGQHPFVLGKEVIRLGLGGLFNPGLAYLFVLIGLSMTNASMVSLIWATEPAFILGLAWLLLKERPTNLMLACLLVAMVGATLVIGVFTGLEGSGMLVGNLLVVLSVCCGAVYTVLSRKSVVSVHPLLLTAGQQTVALVWAVFVWLVFFQEGAVEILVGLDGGMWFWIGVSGLVYYALAFGFYSWGLREMPAIEAGLYLNLIPVFGVGGAYLFLGDRLTGVQWVGAVFILGAVVAISLVEKGGENEKG